MAAIRELYLTSLFLLFSQISGQQSGNATIKQCGSSNLNIVFNFSLGSENFYERYWYLNSTTNKIAAANSAGILTVEQPFSGRVTLSGTNGITLSHVNSSDSGIYLFVIVTDGSFTFLTATTTVIINEIPNNSCKPITTNYINSITCKIPDACPGKDRLQAKWNGGHNDVLNCPSSITTCCAMGDPVTYCYNESLCAEDKCEANASNGKQCQSECELELGLGLGLGLGIPIVITVIVVVIFIVTDYKHPYILGLVLGIGLGVTFIVGCIIIASLISTGTASYKLELGLGFGLSSGILCLIAGIIAVIFIFFQFPLFKGIPKRDELGKGILTGLLFASVIGIIVVYLIYDKLKRESTCIEPDNKPREPAGKIPEQVPLEPTDKKSKTNNSGSSSAVSREHVSVRMENKGFKSDEEERPTAVHTRTQNKFDPNTNSKQTNDRQQPVPPANTGFEDTPTFRRLPQPPQNIKDRNQRGISATIDDTSDLASETPRPNKLPPLTPKQTVQKEDASEEPKKKKKKKKKKDQMNVETPEEENGETDLMVN